MLKASFWFTLAAFSEIAGCYAFWLWLRLKKGPEHLLYGLPFLLLFAYALTKIDAAHAGRVYATYSVIYLVASLVWMKAVENATPDCWDLLGSAICLIGAAVIILPAR